MSVAWAAFVAAPPIAFAMTAYAFHPRDAVIASLRLAAVRAALAVGGYAVLTVEVLGGLGGLTAPALALAWTLGLALAAALAWRRRGPLPRLPRDWTRPERWLLATVGGLLLVELVIALLAEPNNFDSQTYHLPKVEHWAAQGDLEFWPTAIHRQVDIPPGAEYLLLHLRLFTGGDALYNLVQWVAGVGCLVVASRIAAQLGGGRRAQLITAFVVGTTPMVALQATSTQTDLVVAAWAGCVATLALDGLVRRAGFADVVALGAATGLTAITKTSGLLGAGPMLVFWGITQLRRSVPRAAVASLGIVVVAAAFAGPFLLRVYADFGHPLGPPRLRESIPMQRHDPASVLVNGLRIGHTALDTPISPLRSLSADAIVRFADLIGVDSQDRATTFGRTEFPVRSWYPDEDRVAFPIAGTLALIGGVLALSRPRRLVAVERADALRGYAITCAAIVLVHSAMIKWQPWGNRLLLYALVLATPLAGLWLDAILRHTTKRTAPPTDPEPRVEAPRRDLDQTREPSAEVIDPRLDQIPKTSGDGPADAASAEPADAATRGSAEVNASGPAEAAPADPMPVTDGARRPRAAVVAVAIVLAMSALAGVLAVSYGFPRRLVGTGSLLTTDSWDTRFLRRPAWADEFRWAADQVEASGARRVGLVQQNDNWEYPWWLLLRDQEIIALQSVLPERPPADPHSVDVIVCTGEHRPCERLVPDGWHLEWRGYVAFATP
ncbi:hypothetical protein WEI85_04045 [Actinomycetes bacterium KLBMP 9797]